MMLKDILTVKKIRKGNRVITVKLYPYLNSLDKVVPLELYVVNEYCVGCKAHSTWSKYLNDLMVVYNVNTVSGLYSRINRASLYKNYIGITQALKRAINKQVCGTYTVASVINVKNFDATTSTVVLNVDIR